MRRSLLLALILLSPVVGLGSAAVVVQPEPESLVEGHTVFTVISNAPDALKIANHAAAVAILVREATTTHNPFYFPGVLWFNDQYLVNPEGAPETSRVVRYPCSGAVFAVSAGDPDPRAHGWAAYNTANYVESYYLTDPNNRAWAVHKWNISGRFVWTNAILNTASSSNTSDNGSSTCNPVNNGGSANNNPPSGYKYPCGGNGDPQCQAIQYNALLFFYIADLDVPAAPKNHTAGAYDHENDVSGCHEPPNPQPGVRNWECPMNADDREGNSHPYNPQPLQFGGIQRSSHGYSADCTGDAVVDEDCHATRRIDIYYGAAPAPASPRYRFQDTNGSNAPYHCHASHSTLTDYCT